jgi:dehydrogenase/reductase SDR family member 12
VTGNHSGTLSRSTAVRIADALLEASIAGSFSRIGIVVRSRLLPEFTTDQPTSLDGRVVLVTGATSGLGLAIGTELARRHATVHFLARDEARAVRAQHAISAVANASVTYGIADMSDLESIRHFAREFRSKYEELSILVHNAGAMHGTYSVSSAGIELTFAGQVIAPYLLTRLLLPQLRAAAPARVIVVSSGGMYAQPLSRSVSPSGPVGYRGAAAYSRAKRAQVALNGEWARRTSPGEIAFHAMHPGWADTPGVAASLPLFHRLTRPVLRTPRQGADTAIWLATTDPVRLGTGQFWHDRKPRPEHLLRKSGSDDDAATAVKLWDSLAAMTDEGMKSR